MISVAVFIHYETQFSSKNYKNRIEVRCNLCADVKIFIANVDSLSRTHEILEEYLDNSKFCDN